MAMVHVSNVLGEVNDVAAIQKLVRSAGNAHLVVDGVAYAPHLAIDVSAWAVDWCVARPYCSSQHVLLGLQLRAMRMLI